MMNLTINSSFNHLNQSLYLKVKRNKLSILEIILPENVFGKQFSFSRCGPRPPCSLAGCAHLPRPGRARLTRGFSSPPFVCAQGLKHVESCIRFTSIFLSISKQLPFAIMKYFLKHFLFASEKTH